MGEILVSSTLSVIYTQSRFYTSFQIHARGSPGFYTSFQIHARGSRLYGKFIIAALKSGRTVEFKKINLEKKDKSRNW